MGLSHFHIKTYGLKFHPACIFIIILHNSSALHFLLLRLSTLLQITVTSLAKQFYLQFGFETL